MEDIPIKIPENPAKFMDKFRFFIRARGMAYKTEQTYVNWVLAYIKFHNKQHPIDLNESHVEKFLNDLAVNQNLAPNTQRTALNAILFLYKTFLEIELKPLRFKYSKKAQRLPVVFSNEEASKVISHLEHPYKLMAQLMFGAGLRVSECLRLRVKDIDFDMNVLLVRDGKGGKDRSTVIPKSIMSDLRLQIEFVSTLHKRDLSQGFGEVYLPYQLEKKYPSASTSLAWQYIFPAPSLSVDPRSNKKRRHHLMDRIVQINVKKAVKAAGIEKNASCHTFRHSFATSLLRQGYDIRTIQELLGHSRVETTEIYTHVIKQGANEVISPVDL